MSRETPPKKDAAPMRAKAPGSSQAQKGVVWIPNIVTARQPTNRPNSPPINLGHETKCLNGHWVIEGKFSGQRKDE